MWTGIRCPPGGADQKPLDLDALACATAVFERSKRTIENLLLKSFRIPRPPFRALAAFK